MTYSGRGDMIRTRDILLPKQALYQTELRPDSEHYNTYLLKIKLFKYP